MVGVYAGCNNGKSGALEILRRRPSHMYYISRKTFGVGFDVSKSAGGTSDNRASRFVEAAKTLHNSVADTTSVAQYLGVLYLLLVRL